MMSEKLQEIHPGKVLSEDFVRPMGLTIKRLAANIGVPVGRIRDIVNGHKPITIDTAARLAVFFDMEVRFWLNLQTEYDLRVMERELMPKIKLLIRPLKYHTKTEIT